MFPFLQNEGIIVSKTHLPELLSKASMSFEDKNCFIFFLYCTAKDGVFKDQMPILLIIRYYVHVGE